MSSRKLAAGLLFAAATLGAPASHAQVDNITVTSSPGSDDHYTVGETITIQLDMGRFAVESFDNTRVKIDIGGQTRTASLRSSDNRRGMGTPHFDYRVQREDEDLDGISIPANPIEGQIFWRDPDAGGALTEFDLTHAGLMAQSTHLVNVPPLAFGRDVSVPPQTYLSGNTVGLTLPAASGGVGTLSYALAGVGGEALPTGLTYAAPGATDSHGGILSGTPGAAAATTTYRLTVQATASPDLTLDFPITVVTATTDAYLSNLALSSSLTLSPAFAPGITTYTALADNAVSSLMITPTARSTVSGITVAGSAVTSGSASSSVSLNIGANAIPIVVTAQDSTTTVTYLVTATRQGPADGADLSALTLADNNGTSVSLSPSFAADTFSYTADVAGSVTSVTVTPTAQVAGATLWVNGTEVTSGAASGAIALNFGTNFTLVTVRGADGVTYRLYSISITRPITRTQNQDADLSALSFSPGVSLPVNFASDTLSYTASVPAQIERITVTPTASDAANAIISVDNTADGTPAQTVANNQASQPIPLQVGLNPITFRVLAQDRSVSKTYTVTVTRPGTARLQALSVQACLPQIEFEGRTITCPPGTNYAPNFDTRTAGPLTLPNNIARVRIAPTASDSTAGITVNGVAVNNANFSGDVSLTAGDNTIPIVITASHGGGSQTVNLSVRRLSTELSGLTLSAGTLTPPVAFGTTTYTATVPNSVSNITVTPTAADPAVTIYVQCTAADCTETIGSNMAKQITSGNASPAINLSPGANTINVWVDPATAGSAPRANYVLSITREAPDPAPTVSALAFDTFPASGGNTFGLGENVGIRATFDRPIIVTGQPQLELTIGTGTRQSVFSQAFPRQILFSYSVQSADRDTDGVSIAADALSLNGGSIRGAGANGVDANLNHSSVATDPRRRVDGSITTAPAVTAVRFINVPPNAAYIVGDSIGVQVEFNQAVTVTGQPQLNLSIGSANRTATYQHGSGSQFLAFAYTLQINDRDTDGEISVVANSLALNSGTINSAAAHATVAVLTHSTATTAAQVVLFRLSVIAVSDQVAEGDNAVFSVRLNVEPLAGSQVLVDWAISGDITTADYRTMATSPLAFTSTNLEQRLTVAITDDVVQEPAEALSLTLVNPSGGDGFVGLGQASATTTIAASDEPAQPAPPMVSIAPMGFAAEGGNVEFAVTVAGRTMQTVTVTYDLADDAFREPSNQAQPGDLSDGGSPPMGLTTFPGNQTVTVNAGNNETATISVPIFDDNIPEGLEYFTVRLTGASGGATQISPTASTATATIALSDPTGVYLTTSRAAVTEGSNAEFIVTAPGTTLSTVTVTYDLAAAAANPAQAADLTDGAMTFPTTQMITVGTGTDQTATITIAIFDDIVTEAAESFNVALTGASGGATLVDTTPVLATIAANDPTARLPVFGGFVFEFGNAELIVTVAGTTTSAVTVTYAVAADTSVSPINQAQPGDFRAGATQFPSGQVTIAAGTDQTATITIAIFDDDVTENVVEWFRVTLTGASGGTSLVDATRFSRVIISTSDLAPVAPAATARVTGPTDSVTEGDNAEFVVTTHGMTTNPVTVTYDVAAASRRLAANRNLPQAADLSDGSNALTSFPTSQMITVGTGLDQTATITIATFDDTFAETAESFTVILTGASGGTNLVDTTPATATIAANDPATASITGPAAELNEGENAEFVFTVSGGTTTNAVIVTYDVASVLANGAQAADLTDGAITLPTAQVITVGAGADQTATLTIATFDDAIMEAAESFSLSLTGASGGTNLIDTTPAIATIALSDQSGVYITGPDTKVGEGRNADFTVTVPGTTTSEVTVSYEVSGSGANPTVPADFGDGTATDFPSSMLTIAAGADQTVTLSIPLYIDGLIEPEESFTVTLIGASGGTSTLSSTVASATATTSASFSTGPTVVLLNSVNQPPLTVTEGGTAEFPITLRSFGTQVAAVTVTYQVSGSGATTSGDFAVPAARSGALPFSGTVTIPAGADQTAIISIAIFDDTAMEGEENFTVTLTGVSAGINLGNDRATGIIRQGVIAASDQAAGVFITGPGTVDEGRNARFRVTAPGTTTTPVTVTYSAGGSSDRQAAANDFGDGSAGNFPSGMVTIMAGTDQTATITIAIFDDVASERPEGFAVSLTGASGGMRSTSAARAVAIINPSDPIAMNLVARPVSSEDLDPSRPGLQVQEGDSVDIFLDPRDWDGNTRVSIIAHSGGSAWNAMDISGRGCSGDPCDPGFNSLFTGFWEGFRYTINDDAEFELEESFTVTINQPEQVTQFATEYFVLGDISVTVTILPNDGPEYTIAGPAADTALTEGDTLTVMVEGSAQPMAAGEVLCTLNPDTSSGRDATETADFNTLTSRARFTPMGATTASCTFTIADDTLGELAEYFTISLSSPPDNAVTGASYGAARNFSIARSDLATVNLAGPAAVLEGANAEFVVTATGATTSNITVTYSVATVGTAGAAAGDLSDGSLASFPTDQTITVNGGIDQTATITIAVFDDATAESSEAFMVTLTGATGPATLSNTTATTTIAVSDQPAGVYLAGPTEDVTEGNNADFTVTVAGTTTGEVTVSYDVATAMTNGAQAADLSDGSLANFPSGQMITISAGTNQTATISLITFDDALAEAAESFTVTLTDASGGTSTLSSTAASANATITASDLATANITGPAAEVTEGEVAEFVVTVSGGTTESDVTVTYEVAAAAADPTEAADLTDGAISFPTAQMITVGMGADQTATITIATFDDTLAEAAEAFTVTLTGVSGDTSTFDGTAATATIAASDLATAGITGPAAEITEGEMAEFVVTVSGSTTESEVIVTYEVAAAAADPAQAADLTDGATSFPSGQTVTVGAGSDQTATITIATFDDTLAEAAESFTVTLTGVSSGATMLSSSAASVTTTIAASDLATARVTGPAAEITEGEMAEFVVTVSGGTTESDVTVTYDVAAAMTNPAQATDLTDGATNFPTAQMITVGMGTDQTATITIATFDDTLAEAAEAFTVTLTGVSSGTVMLSSNAATATIATSDQTAGVYLSGPAAVTEGSNAEFTVTVPSGLASRPFGADESVVVTYNVAAAVANPAQAADLTDGATSFPTSQTVTIAEGLPTTSVDRTVTITLPIFNDIIAEAAEAFTVTLTGASGGTTMLSSNAASVTTTIAPSDPATARVTGPAANITEGGNAEFVITVSGGTITESDVTVTYDVAAAATNPAQAADLTDGATSFPTAQMITVGMGAGQTATITIATLDDMLAEAAESFTVTLTGAGGGTTLIDDTPAAATIAVSDQADQTGVSLSGPAAVTEGSNAEFTVTANGTTTSAVTVTYDVTSVMTNGIQAADLSDGGSPPMALTSFPSGQMVTISAGAGQTAMITLATFDDTLAEANEAFMLTLTGASGGATTLSSSAASARTTLRASDPATAGITGPAGNLTEGDNAEFVITVSGTTESEVTVTYDVVSLLLDGAQAADLGNGRVAFPTGQTVTVGAGTDQTATITIATFDDTLGEADESFIVTLSGASGSNIRVSNSSTASAIIAANDVIMGFTATSYQEDEDVGQFQVCVAVTNPPDTEPLLRSAFFLSLSTTAGTAGTSDYTAIDNERIGFFSENFRDACYSIEIIDDMFAEENESFFLDLTAQPGETLPGIAIDPARATVTINDDDPAAMAGITGPADNLTEGANAEFVVTVSGTTESDVTVTYDVASALADGAQAADLGNGRVAFPTSQMITVGAGMNQTATITIATFNDTLAEAAESFTVTLTGTSNNVVTVNTTPATATISANDITVGFAQADYSMNEAVGTSMVCVNIINPPTTESFAGMFSLAVSTRPGTAGTNDFTVITAQDLGPFNDTTRQQCFSVAIANDAFIEDNEGFFLDLTTQAGETLPGVTINPAITEITINDDDPAAMASITGPAVNLTEGDNAEFVVTVSGTTESDVTVTYNLATVSTNGAEPADLSDGGSPTPMALSSFPISQMITVGGGTDQTATITIATFNDTAMEGDESFTVSLTGVNSDLAVVSTTGATATIAASDQTDIFITGPANEVTEGANAEFVVTVPGTTTSDVTVTYNLATVSTNGAEPADLSDGATSFLTDRITVGMGTDQTATITIATFDDAIVEPLETFTVTLTGAGGGRTTVSSTGAGASAQIMDNDRLVLRAAQASYAIEEDTSPTSVCYTTEQAISIGFTATVTVQESSPVSAIDNMDFIAGAARTLRFPVSDSGNTRCVQVGIVNDNVAEDAETFEVALSPAAGLTLPLADLSRGQTRIATVTINANDSTTVNVAGPATEVSEGEMAEFIVRVAGITTSAVTVTYDVAAAAANPAQPADLMDGATSFLTDQTITVGMGMNQTATITIATSDDTVAEAAESFTVTLTGVSGRVNMTDNTAATATIALSDRLSVVIAPGQSTSVSEGEMAEFVVTAQGNSATGLMVTYNVAAALINDPAQAADLSDGGSPTPVALTTFPSGQTITIGMGTDQTTTITLATFDDTLAEAAESFIVTLTGANSNLAVISTTDATATIAPSDQTDIFITGPANEVTEGANAEFVVTVPSTTTSDVIVAYDVAAAAANPAQAADLSDGGSPTPMALTTFPTGQTLTVGMGANQTATITIATFDDTVMEAAESFTVTLTGASGGTTLIDDTPAVATIALSDQTGVFITGPANVIPEGEMAEFVVTAPGTTATDVIVSYSVTATNINGIEVEDLSDGSNALIAFPTDQIITIGMGADQTATITIAIFDDAITEAAESFTVALTGVSGGATMVSGTASTATATIADQIGVFITAPANEITEGGNAEFVVTVPGTTTSDVIVSYDVAAAAANPAQAADLSDGSSATFPTGRMITVSMGTNQTATITITIFDDAITEAAESFTVTLTGVSGGATMISSTSATATIAASDPPSVSITGPANEVTEGANAEFVVTASGTTTSDVIVSYDVAAAAANPAQAADLRDGSLVAFPTGRMITVSMGTNQTATITITIFDDAITEAAESFTVTLTGASGGATMVSSTSATATIAASDQTSVFITGPANEVTEGGNAEFVVTVPGTTSSDVIVSYDVAAAAANPAQAADLSDGSLASFPTGQTITIGMGADQTATITIATFDDTLAEAAESFTVTLTGVSGGATMVSGTASTATATIAPSDQSTSVSITGPANEVTEGGNAEFVVTALGTTASDVIVTYDLAAAAANPAQADDLRDGSLASFPTGQTLTIGMGTNQTATITIAIFDDAITEAAESFTVTLTGVSGGATIVSGTAASAAATIAENDAMAPDAAQMQRLTMAVETFSRMNTDLFVNALNTRMSRPQRTLNVGGRSLNLQDLLSYQERSANAFPESQLAGQDATIKAKTPIAGKQSQDLTAFLRMLGNSYFLYNLGADETDDNRLSKYSVWGLGQYIDAKGKSQDNELTPSYEGDAYGFYFGLDRRASEKFMLGAAVGYSHGEVEVGLGNVRTKTEQTLASLYPYMVAQLGHSLRAWVSMGYGQGTLEATENGHSLETDTSLWLGAGGLNQSLRWGNLDATWRLSGKAAYNRVDAGVFSDGRPINQLRVKTKQTRAEIELGYRALFQSLSVRPFLSVGLLHDGGRMSGDDTAKIFGAGLEYAWLDSLQGELRWHYQQRDNNQLDERLHVVSASMSYDTGPKLSGLLLSLKTELGQGKAGHESPLDSFSTGQQSPNNNWYTNIGTKPQLAAEVAYGLTGIGLLGHHGLFKPYILTEFAERGKSHASGLRFESNQFTLETEIQTTDEVPYQLLLKSEFEW